MSSKNELPQSCLRWILLLCMFAMNYILCLFYHYYFIIISLFCAWCCKPHKSSVLRIWWVFWLWKCLLVHSKHSLLPNNEKLVLAADSIHSPLNHSFNTFWSPDSNLLFLINAYKVMSFLFGKSKLEIIIYLEVQKW